MQNGLDRLLATYCSPTLAGIKPASLVSCDRNLYPDLPQRLKRNTAMRSQREKFTSRSSAPAAHASSYWYTASRSLNAAWRTRRCSMCSGTLRTRSVSRSTYCCAISSAASPCPSDFPHEIGLFLGYPIEDVVGFIRYAGKGCKLSGLWKVYGDAEAASRLFDRLSRVCHAVTRRVDKGETLLEVFAA